MTLDIQNLTFRYDTTPVLDGVTLSVDAGELVGLLGPNGSGKSTLLQCCLQLLTPDAGQIRIDGTTVDSLSANERARRVGYVPQSESEAFPATVFETVLQGRRPHGGWSPSATDRTATEHVIDRLGLADLAHRQLSELSGGQRQKVRLARALVGTPSVLLLDEPTSALDLHHQIDVMEHIRTHVQKQTVAGIMAVHDLNLAARYCDRVALLHEGSLHTVGPPEVLTPETIRTVYGVEATIQRHDDRRIVIPETTADSSGQ